MTDIHLDVGGGNAGPANSAPDRGEDLEQLVIETRRRLRRAWVLTGSALLVAATLAWLVLSALADLLVPLPVALRVFAWGVLWVVFAAALLGAVLWPALRPLKLEHVAGRIERAIGAMHNRLITVLDVRRREREVGAGVTEPQDLSGAFTDRLIQ